MTHDGFVLVGWGRHSVQGAVPQVLVHRFDPTGKLVASPVEISPLPAQGEGIAEDREKKLVIAGYQTKVPTWNAWVFGTIGADKPHAWADVQAQAVAFDVACGPWGRCTWVGNSVAGKTTALVSAHAP